MDEERERMLKGCLLCNADIGAGWNTETFDSDSGSEHFSPKLWIRRQLQSRRYLLWFYDILCIFSDCRKVRWVKDCMQRVAAARLSHDAGMRDSHLESRVLLKKEPIQLWLLQNRNVDKGLPEWNASVTHATRETELFLGRAQWRILPFYKSIYARIRTYTRVSQYLVTSSRYKWGLLFIGRAPILFCCSAL